MADDLRPEAQVVRLEARGAIASLVLCARATGNAIDARFVDQLEATLERVAAMDNCRVIVLEAEGEHFCRGLSLELLVEGGPDASLMRRFQACLERLCASTFPSVCALRGRVTGGGLGLVACCDLVLAEEAVTFALPEVVVGLIPAVISPYLLRRLSAARLRYLALSSREVTAGEAHEFGLVDEVCPAGALEAALDAQLKRLLRSSPVALAAVKSLVDRMAAAPKEERDRGARESLEDHLRRPGVMEGARQFAGGLAPPWFVKLEPRRG